MEYKLTDDVVSGLKYHDDIIIIEGTVREIVGCTFENCQLVFCPTDHVIQKINGATFNECTINLPKVRKDEGKIWIRESALLRCTITGSLDCECIEGSNFYIGDIEEMKLYRNYTNSFMYLEIGTLETFDISSFQFCNTDWKNINGHSNGHMISELLKQQIPFFAKGLFDSRTIKKENTLSLYYDGGKDIKMVKEMKVTKMRINEFKDSYIPTYRKNIKLQIRVKHPTCNFS